MSGWASDQLDNLVSFKKGKKVETSPFLLAGFKRYLGAGALVGKHDGYASTYSSVLATETDVLMLWDGERSGLVGHNLNGVVSSTVSKLSPNGQVSTDYLYYYLLNNFDWIQNRRTGTGVPHVPKDLGRILLIKYPIDSTYQIKISSVLSGIDQTIELTEALIEKYQQIKAGLMHDLFTRGITADGKLRPTREQAPELYQETPIGWIPKEWALNTIIDLANPSKGSTVIGPFGSDLVMSDYRSEGTPIVFVRDVKENGFNWVSNVFISSHKTQALFSHRVKPGDILATKMGLPPCVAAVYPENMPLGIITADIIRMTPDRSKVNPIWLSAAINHDCSKRQVAAITAGVTRPKVTLADFRSLKIAVPSPAEQELEVKLIISKQQIIAAEEKKLEKLKKQKSGLMHDLLTGKVPVKVSEPEAAHV